MLLLIAIGVFVALFFGTCYFAGKNEERRLANRHPHNNGRMQEEKFGMQPGSWDRAGRAWKEQNK